MTTTPLPPRPGEPTDPELRDRYLTDAAREREERRGGDAELLGRAADEREREGCGRHGSSLRARLRDGRASPAAVA